MHGRGLGEEAKALEQLGNFFAERRTRKGPIYHVVCLSDLSSQWHLAVNASKSLGAGKVVSFLETGNLGCSVCGDDDSLIDTLVNAGFEEQRDVVDHHGMRVFSCGLFCQPGLFARDTRVNDCFERTAFRWMEKDDGSERVAIEAMIRIQDDLAKEFDDGSPGWFTWLDDLSRQQVGIDHHCAALSEHVRDGALAGGDTACEAYQNHRCGA